MTPKRIKVKGIVYALALADSKDGLEDDIGQFTKNSLGQLLALLYRCQKQGLSDMHKKLLKIRQTIESTMPKPEELLKAASRRPR
jgi:hypothetical protein